MSVWWLLVGCWLAAGCCSLTYNMCSLFLHIQQVLCSYVGYHMMSGMSSLTVWSDGHYVFEAQSVPNYLLGLTPITVHVHGIPCFSILARSERRKKERTPRLMPTIILPPNIHVHVHTNRWGKTRWMPSLESWDGGIKILYGTNSPHTSKCPYSVVKVRLSVGTCM